MKLVIQRVKDACVMAEGEETGRIGPGFLVLVGIMEGDTEDLCGYLAEKTANLRVFTDEDDKLNRSLKDVGGAVLAVSNFTLGGDCKKGHRPTFIRSAKQPLAEELMSFIWKSSGSRGSGWNRGGSAPIWRSG